MNLSPESRGRRCRTIIVAGCCLWLLLGLAASAAEDTDAAAAQAYRQGYNMILDEDWQAAIAVFDDLIKRYGRSEWADDSEFWRCYAREQLGESAARLFDCYEALLARAPHSEWADDAQRTMVRLARKLAREGAPEYQERVRGFGRDEDGDGLLAVLVALGEIGDERSVAVIFERIEATEDEFLRARIVEVLDDIDTPQVVEKLVALMRRDPSLRVRLSALEALGDHPSADAGGLLREIAADSEQPLKLRVAALDELADHDAPGLVAFLRDLALSAGHGDLAEEAVDTLGELTSAEAFAALGQIYSQAGDPELREEALEAVADYENQAAIDFLHQAALAAPGSALGRRAVRLIGGMETAAAFATLRELAASDLDWRLRAAALSSLADLESAAALKVIAGVLGEAREPRLRGAAVDALEETELDGAVEILLGVARRDPDPELRRRATHALGEIKSEAAREALIELLEETTN